MNIFSMFQTILYTISTALLLPVVVLLILLCLWLFVYTGGFIGEWIKRKKMKLSAPLSEFLETIQQTGRLPDPVRAALPAHIAAYSLDLENILKQPSPLKAEQVENLNQKKENALLNGVDRIRSLSVSARAWV
jgi:uncharacterized protein YneF (UPF0154 family)